jgi:hypothetical protein
MSTTKLILVHLKLTMLYTTTEYIYLDFLSYDCSHAFCKGKQNHPPSFERFKAFFPNDTLYITTGCKDHQPVGSRKLG